MDGENGLKICTVYLLFDWVHSASHADSFTSQDYRVKHPDVSPSANQDQRNSLLEANFLSILRQLFILFYLFFLFFTAVPHEEIRNAMKA